MPYQIGYLPEYKSRVTIELTVTITIKIMDFISGDGGKFHDDIVKVVLGPILCDQEPLGIRPVEHLCPRVGRRDVELHEIRLHVDREVKRLFHGVDRFPRISVHEGQAGSNTGFLRHLDDRFNLLQVDPLTDVFQDIKIRAFNAVADHVTTGRSHGLKGHGIGVIDPGHAGPSDPDIVFFEQITESFDPRRIGRKRVIVKTDLFNAILLLQHGYLVNDALRTAVTHAFAERTIAKGASPRTSSRRKKRHAGFP